MVVVRILERSGSLTGYRGKVAQQEQARLLRSEGMTLLDIAHRIGVSKSSVSLWVRDVDFVARPRSRARRRGPNALQHRKQAEIDELLAEGVAQIGKLSDREFLVAGATLYAGEGAKRDGIVAFANSDPRMVKLFCRWLQHFFDIDESRLRLCLYLHEGLDLESAVSFWSGLTSIPSEQFGKPYRAVPDPSIRRAKHVNGVVCVRYSCARTHRAVMGLMHALLDDAALPG